MSFKNQLTLYAIAMAVAMIAMRASGAAANYSSAVPLEGHVSIADEDGELSTKSVALMIRRSDGRWVKHIATDRTGRFRCELPASDHFKMIYHVFPTETRVFSSTFFLGSATVEVDAADKAKRVNIILRRPSVRTLHGQITLPESVRSTQVTVSVGLKSDTVRSVRDGKANIAVDPDGRFAIEVPYSSEFLVTAVAKIRNEHVNPSSAVAPFVPLDRALEEGIHISVQMYILNP